MNKCHLYEILCSVIEIYHRHIFFFSLREFSVKVYKLHLCRLTETHYSEGWHHGYCAILIRCIIYMNLSELLILDCWSLWMQCHVGAEKFEALKPGLYIWCYYAPMYSQINCWISYGILCCHDHHMLCISIQKQEQYLYTSLCDISTFSCYISWIFLEILFRITKYEMNQ